MHMDNFVFRVLPEKIPQLTAIALAEGIQHWKAIDFSSQRLNFIVLGGTFFPVRQKIKLYIFPVDMPVIVHQHRFQPTAIHMGHYMQNPNHRFLHPLQLKELIEKLRNRNPFEQVGKGAV